MFDLLIYTLKCFPSCFFSYRFRNSTTKASLTWAQPKSSSPQELKIGSPKLVSCHTWAVEKHSPLRVTQKRVRKSATMCNVPWCATPRKQTGFIWFQCFMMCVGVDELMPATKIDHAMVVFEWFCWNMLWTCKRGGFHDVMWHDHFRWLGVSVACWLLPASTGSSCGSKMSQMTSPSKKKGFQLKIFCCDTEWRWS